MKRGAAIVSVMICPEKEPFMSLFSARGVLSAFLCPRSVRPLSIGFPILVAMAAAAMTGCIGFGRSLEKPSVSLAGIDMLESTGWEMTWRVELRVTNPNDADLVVRGGDCRLDVAGKELARGVIQKGDQVVPALGTSVVSFQLHASVTDLMRGVWRLAEGEKPSYALTGSIRLGGGVIPPVVPFSADGILKLDGKRRK